MRFVALRAGERAFNTGSSQAELEAEWGALPPGLAQMLAPFRRVRRDDNGVYTAIVIQLTESEQIALDVALIAAASEGDCGKALKFIVCEICALVKHLREGKGRG